MDIQVLSRVNEHAFAGDCSNGPVLPFRPIRYLKDSKQRSRESEFQPTRSPQQMVDRDDAHGEARSARKLGRESTQIRTISISIDKQPPPEVRPGNRLPTIVVDIRRLRQQRSESWMGEEGSLWAQVSLMSADGQMAMALLAPDILDAEDMVTPLFREFSATRTEERWSLAFRDLKIRHSGYFKIHIAVLRSSQSEERGDEDPAIEPPRELMGVDTQVIRVHAFAPS